MYAYIKGKITHRSPNNAVIETGGVGYWLQIPLSTFSAIEGLEEATLYTHLIVREDAHILYGFATQTERSLFTLLISVTGVGAATAQLILSAMSVDEIRAAIIGEQTHTLQRVKGIGAKTAKQIILDLKDKMTKGAGDLGDAPVLMPAGGPSEALREEALMALLGLGFGRIPAQKAIAQALKNNPGVGKVEDLIKQALRILT